MGKFSDILLTVDFDRTLTAPDSTVPARNIEAIRYFMAEGGAFTVNTGRSVPMYSAYLDAVPVNAPLLLYNGAAAYDKDAKRFLFTAPIDLEQARTLRTVQQLLPQLALEVQGVDKHYLFQENEMWDAYCAHNGCPYGHAQITDDLGPFLKFTLYGQFREPTVAHLYRGSEEELRFLDEAARRIEAAFPGKVQVFRAAPRILDVQTPGLSKGTAARRLLRELGRSTLVCVGDGMNDIQMLEEADYAYCPAGSIIEGRYETVCDCAQGAVADVIFKKIPEILG